MDKLYTNTEYVEKLSKIVTGVPTFYAWGAFGAPAGWTNSSGRSNKERYKVPNAKDTDFLFDCSGFMYRALPWGWVGDRSRCYGGAYYPSDPNDPLYALLTNDIMSICDDVSTDFSNIMVGEALYMTGHVGLYVGNGKAAECTSAWTNGSLFSEVQNCKITTGLPYKRTWLKHGKLPFVKYEQTNPIDPVNPDKLQLEYDKINEIRKNLDELEALL